jgi:hypothetical protein
MDPKNISFQDVINGIPDPILVIDVNNYKIISSNTALNEQAGGRTPLPGECYVIRPPTVETAHARGRKNHVSSTRSSLPKRQ